MFNIFKSKKEGSAGIAKLRLEAVLSKNTSSNQNFLPELRKDILNVLSKYINIENENDIYCDINSKNGEDIFELNINLHDNNKK